MRLVFLGLPGAGKGTQGEQVSARIGVPHISTGKMFRDAIYSETPIGVRARAYINRGELVPDELAIEIVKERLSQPDCEKGFILDGFPRSVPQAKALDEALPTLGTRLDRAVNIQITGEEAIRRIANRIVCEQCGATYNRTSRPTRRPGVCDDCGGPLTQRADDTEETARNRLRVYLDQTHPVVEYYKARGVLITVDGQQAIAAVFAEIMEALASTKQLSSPGEQQP